MRRKYLETNVYDTLRLRLHFIFQEFENIYAF